MSRVIYVCGPYRDSRGEWYVHQNIEEAKCITRELWLMGAVPICPHANSAMFGGHDIPDHVWLDGDLEILKRCDAVVAMPHWTKSKGATCEVEFAHRNGIPVFIWSMDVIKLREWLQRG